jgi:hypothetical protein
MSKPDDKDPIEPKQPRREKISYDSRGNPVWQWAVDSGRHLMESTSLLLKRLDIPGLKLEDDESAGKSESEANSGKVSGSQADAGYDPYSNKRVAPKGAVRPAVRKPVAAPTPRRSWWQRLFRRG